MRLVEGIAQRAQADGFVIHWGRKVLEVRPPVRIDKGAAVAGLIRGGNVRCAIYVGDDTTDLDAFNALSELTSAGELDYGLRVGVRSDDGPAGARGEHRSRGRRHRRRPAAPLRWPRSRRRDLVGGGDQLCVSPSSCAPPWR